jgi:hypothetical protein
MVKIPNKRAPKKAAPVKVKENASLGTDPEVTSSDTAHFMSGLVMPGRTTLVTMGFILFSVFVGAIFAAWPIISFYLLPLIQGKDDPPVAAIEGSLQSFESLAQTQNRQEAEIKFLESQRSQFIKQIRQLIKRLDEQERALSAVKKLAQATTPSSVRQAANNSLEKLSDRLLNLEQNSGSISKIIERIAFLEKETEVKDSAAAKVFKSQYASGGALFSSPKIVMAVLQLSHALLSSAPFSEDLNQLKKLATNRPEIKKSIAFLEPHMTKGIPTLVLLRSKFESIAPSIIRANQGTIDSDWVDQTLGRLSSLVLIRKSGPNIKGNDVEAIIARTEENLKLADLPAALKMLKTLPEKSREAAADWARSVKTRLIAEREINSLHLLAVGITESVQRGVDSPLREKE